jgi:L,D-peptidoglycan transpeptidase YkuD (ErfK/YbiS/YcfS/YnhG family)
VPRGRTLALVALVVALVAATLGACTTSGTSDATSTPGASDRVALSGPHPTPSEPAPHRTRVARSRTAEPQSTPPRTRTRSPGHQRPSNHASQHPGRRDTTTTSAPPRASAPPSTHPRRPGSPLPLDDPTGDATQVLTVVAGAQSDTSGTVQAWRRARGGWQRVGPALPAWLGSAGMTPQPRETLSAAPMGSWALTQAFGREPDPGTRLRYTRTTPDDWWISQSGPLYNTLQRCASGCGFTQGDPNEHLYYVAPEYDYAVVIDYNTPDAGPVRPGAGSAFFLHVSGGEPTAGCVAIDESALMRIMRWLDPADHPRILIGTA